MVLICLFVFCQNRSNLVLFNLFVFHWQSYVAKSSLAFPFLICAIRGWYNVISKCRAPQVYYDDNENVKNLKAEVARGAKLKCSRCGKKGAALGCYMKSCRKSYHVPCAAEIANCRWDNVGFMLSIIVGDVSFRVLFASM